MRATWLTCGLLSSVVSVAWSSSSEGSCVSFGCGSDSPSQPCQCDQACESRGDCCSDFLQLCNSCFDVNCNTYDEGRICQCNEDCSTYGDCCSDYKQDCVEKNFEQNWQAPGNSADRRSDPTRLRFLEYNIEWMFTNQSHSMGGSDCPGSGCSWFNNSEARSHMSKVASLIAEMDPDIAVLPETCDVWTLQQLLSMMPNDNQASLYRAYLLKGTDTATGQNVGLLTKIDPFESLNRTEARVDYPIPCGSQYSGNYGCSKHFKTRFIVEGMAQPLTLLGVHFLAYPTDPTRCAKREAQASVVRDFAMESDPNDYFIIAGDMNGISVNEGANVRVFHIRVCLLHTDYDNDVLDAAGDEPLSQVTSILKQWKKPNLVNVASKIGTQNQVYSGWYDKNGDCVDNGGDEHTMIDQVLVSAELFDLISDVHFDHAYENGCGCIYSDHWPLLVEFDLSRPVHRVQP